jgi:hypothetical protein
MIAHLSMHYQVLQDLLPSRFIFLLCSYTLSLLYGLLDRVHSLDDCMYVLLESGHLANDILDNLGRQFLKYLVLSPTEDEGGYTLLKGVQGREEGLCLF